TPAYRTSAAPELSVAPRPLVRPATDNCGEGGDESGSGGGVEVDRDGGACAAQGLGGAAVPTAQLGGLSQTATGLDLPVQQRPRAVGQARGQRPEADRRRPQVRRVLRDPVQGQHVLGGGDVELERGERGLPGCVPG